jgi:hypothetical protein
LNVGFFCRLCALRNARLLLNFASPAAHRTLRYTELSGKQMKVRMKNPLHTLSATLLLSIALPIGHAASPALDPATIPNRVLETAQLYQNAIACANIDQAMQPVLALAPFESETHREEARYAVLWSGDIGCAGGSGTSTANITMIHIGSGDQFYVDVAHSSPQIHFDAPVKLVREVLNYTQDHLTLRGRTYAEGDPHCCPSIDARFTLHADAQGNWLLTEMHTQPINKKEP